MNTTNDPVVIIGQRLGALIKARDYLEDICETTRLGNDLERRRAENTGHAINAEMSAAEDYALAMPCHSLAGAAVHIMLAIARNDLAKHATDDPDSIRDHAQIHAALHSALRVVAGAAGVDMEAFGGSFYSGPTLDPYPTPDLAASG